VGKGRTVYLNLDMHDYIEYRLTPPEGENYRECFRQLLASVYGPSLSSDELVSVAACMLGARNHDLAVRAYREHLRAYPQSARNPEICFRLGILFSRRFQDYDEALKYLPMAAETHSRSDRVARAEEEIRRIQENLARVDASASTLEGTSQRAWVVRQTDDPINLGQVGRLVAREAGMVLAEVTAELPRSRGIILAGAPVEVARRVAQRLQQTGVPVLVIGEEDLVSLPETRPVSRVTISEEGCRFQAGREVRTRAWADVYFVAAGRLREGEPASSRLVVDGPTYQGARGIQRVEHRPGTERVFLCLDFFVLEPWERLRVEEGRTRCVMQTPEGGTRETSQVEQFVRALVEAVPELRGNEFFHLIAAGGYQRQARRFEFDSRLAFDSYCHWLLQLEEHNRPPEAPGR